MNRKAFQNISYGVYIISTKDNERPTGCVANSVMQITSDPATIAISINHDNYTNRCIDRTGKFAVTVLPNNCDPSIIGTFGFQTGEKVNKFDSVSYKLIDGMPIVSEGCAYIICDVTGKNETGTHTIFIGKVTDADIITSDEPMTYSYYHKVVKGKSPKNAPTYIPEETVAVTADKKKYVCGVCGYEYDGETPFEELPDSYTCPICGQPKSVFEIAE